MAPKPPAASEDSSSHDSSLLSSSHSPSSFHSASHPISKPKSHKKGPIIRVVHVFAPKLIKTDVANFRTLVQKLTGNHSSSDDDDEEEEEQQQAKEENSHDHTTLSYFNQASVNHTKQLESSYQREREASAPAYSSAVPSTQFEENYEDPFLRYGILHAGLASNHTGFTARVHDSISNFPANEDGLARIDEREGYFPAANYEDGLARRDEGINYFTANYGYDDANSYSSSSSLDSSSTRGSSLNYERENNPCVFSEELEIMGGFNSSYPFDDQQLPQLFMSALDTKLECSLLNPTW